MKDNLTESDRIRLDAVTKHYLGKVLYLPPPRGGKYKITVRVYTTQLYEWIKEVVFTPGALASVIDMKDDFVIFYIDLNLKIPYIKCVK